MALIDEIRRIAQEKDSYNPALANRARPVRGGRKPTYRAPSPRVSQSSIAEMISRSSPSAPGRPGGRPSQDLPSLASMMGRPTPPSSLGQSGDSDGISVGDVGGWATKGFSGLIDAVDTGRAAVVSGIKEGTDLIPGFEGGDGSFDFDDWKQNTRDNYGFGDLVEQVMGPEGTNRPLWMRQGLGFVGDVVADPLTYLTFGTVQGAKALGKGLSRGALDTALEHGGRKTLAKTIVQEAAERGVSRDAADRLAAAAGQRGRGAFTAKGLARAGVDESVPKALGLTSEIGYRLKLPGSRKGVNIAGSQRVAQASENLKGSMKAWGGSTNASKGFRRLFVGDSSALGQAERAFTDELISGSPNAATAARGLAALGLAKAKSFSWMDDAAQRVPRELPHLQKANADEVAQITHLIEAGVRDGTGQLGKDAKYIADWYDEIGTFLQKEGVEFDFRSNYVNHMLTDQARRAISDGDQRLILHGLTSDAAFQKKRELIAGGKFLGEDIVDGTVDELNTISQRVLGYKVFEDDIRELMGAYLSQAQRAYMRQKTLQYAGDLGVTKELDTVVDKAALAADKKATQAALRVAEKKEMDALKASNRARKKVLQTGARQASDERKVAARGLVEAEEKVIAAGRKVKDLESKITLAQGRLSAQEVALKHWEGQLEAAGKLGRQNRGKAKAAATRQIKKLSDELAVTRGQLDDLQKKLAKESDPDVLQELQGGVTRANILAESTSKKLESTQAAREALDDPNLPVPETVVPAEKVAKASTRVAKTRDEFLTNTKEYGDAANAFVWVQVDQDSAMSALRNRLDNFDRIKEASDNATIGKGAQLKPNRADLRARTKIVLDSFDELGDDPTLNILRNIEAQAAAHDMTAYKAAVTKADRKKWLDALEDPAFQGHMKKVASDGWAAINDKVQVPEFFDEAMKLEAKLADPDAWSGMRKILGGYDKGMNIWKGYATASPGFVFRNGYTGFFNMWLDDVSVSSVSKFNRFLKQYHRESGLRRGAKKIVGAGERDAGLDAALAWAKKTGKYSDQELVNLEGALQAASASGWGLTPQEVSSQLIGSKATLNPVSAEFAPTRGIRNLSSDLEAVMRGAHAFDVLQRGGNINTAIDHVEKFHFNYRDITQFDRAAKRVSPFWTFYSRNMALQAQIWTRLPHKLNRSYFNVKRNLEIGSEPDEVIPGYYEEMGAVRTPFGERDGGSWYFTPDLPSLRFRQDMAQVIGEDGGFSPLRMLSDTGPAIKTPFQLAANRNLFTDIPFKNRLYDYDSDGNMEGREAPGLLQGEIPFTDIEVPVAGEAIQRAANLLPGTELVNDTLLMQDNTQGAVEDFVPLLGRQSRLDPSTDKYQDRQLQSILSFLGAPVRQNTDASIRGELYGRQIDAEKEARQRQIMDELQNIVGG